MASDPATLTKRLRPVLDDIGRRCTVAGNFIDKATYRIYIATLWTNVALDPAEAGLEEGDLEPLFDILNEEIGPVLGAGTEVTDCFRFIDSKPGEQAMNEARVSQSHRDLLHYFCSLILDPEGHKRWVEAHREELDASLARLHQRRYD